MLQRDTSIRYNTPVNYDFYNRAAAEDWSNIAVSINISLFSCDMDVANKLGLVDTRGRSETSAHPCTSSAYNILQKDTTGTQRT